MSATPEVTVLIPTHNRWRLLSLTLAGVLAQEDVDLEVVIVDDGSSDGTSDRLAALEDPRVRTLRNDPSQGVTRARNRGIQEARGRWLAFLDDDDLWAPRKLREQLDVAAREGAAFVYSSAAQLCAGEVREINAAPPSDQLVDRLLARSAMPSGCSNVVVELEALRAIGVFDERVHALADWDLWVRLALANRGAACPAVHVAYVIHESNMHSGQAAEHMEDFDYLERKFRVERERRGVVIDGVAYTRWLAGAARRRSRWTSARIYALGAARYRNVGNAGRAMVAIAGVARKPSDDAESPTVPDWLALYADDGAITAHGRLIATT